MAAARAGGAYEARVSRDASGRKTTRGEDCADGAGSEVDRLYRRILQRQNLKRWH